MFVVVTCNSARKLAIGLIIEREAIALGCRWSLLNHPVKDLEADRVYITSQNHGYYVKELPEEVVATHISMNDGTVEGMKHKTLPIFSVQYHPEACPGPRDADHIFDKFLEL